MATPLQSSRTVRASAPETYGRSFEEPPPQMCRHCDRAVTDCQRSGHRTYTIVRRPLLSCRWSIRVAIDYRAKRMLERTEVSFVGAPFVRCVPVDGSSHLLGARGPDGP